jgi:hypothetical protein
MLRDSLFSGYIGPNIPMGQSFNLSKMDFSYHGVESVIDVMRGHLGGK